MALAHGTRLGPYRIAALLGAGGMGEVYRARDTRLDRDVAIKVLCPKLASRPDALERFEREAKVVAALSHPNILAIHDFGCYDDVHCVITEYLEGEPLNRVIAESPLAWRRSIDIGIAIADGLAVAHAKGITHRDIKPSNVFLTSDGRVKVLDFGLADWTPESHTGDSTITYLEHGAIIGTAAYMSPEQVRGIKVDARSDIFSLGCVLFEMNTGRKAFLRPTAAETMTAVLREHPPEGLMERGPVPVELRRIIARCLEKNSEERFQSARDLAFALRSVLNDRIQTAVIPARPASEKPLDWIERSWYWLTGRRKVIDSVAVLPFCSAGGNPALDYLGDGIAESLINGLSAQGALRVAPRGKAFRYRGADADATKAGRQLHVRAVLTGGVTQRAGQLNVQVDLVDTVRDSQLWGAQYNGRAGGIIAIQDAILAGLCQRLGQTRAEEAPLLRHYTENTDAYQLYLKGRYYWNRRTAATVKQAIVHYEEAISKDPGFALAHSGLADCYAVSGSYLLSTSHESYPKSLAAAAKALSIDDTLAEPHAARGLVKTLYEYDWEGAEAEFERALEMNPGYGTAQQWYGNHLEAAGKLDRAMVQMERAVELEPFSLIINAIHGRTMYFNREYDRAAAQLHKTLDLDPNFAPARSYLGKVYEQKGMYRQAIAEFQDALSLTPGDPQLLGSLGVVYALCGRHEEAIRKIEELDQLSHSRYVWSYDAGIIYVALGNLDLAFERFWRSYEERCSPIAWLKVEPRLDAVRGDPRYVELLERMGLAA